ncbi:MAG: primosomal protein N' [Planctomycetes bacterium]|nr:primosomal protein N' [Planctomycetota bacterium]
MPKRYPERCIVHSVPFARVALAIPVRELFDYRVPEALAASVVPGARVRVPFGRGVRIGYCVERDAECRHPQPKDIAAVLDDEPLLDGALLRFVQWTADYYLASVGEVIESAIPKSIREAAPKDVPWVRLSAAAASDSPPRASAAGARILRHLRERGAPAPLADVLDACAATRAPLRTLARRGAVEIYRAPQAPPPPTLAPPTLAPPLPPRAAHASIVAPLAAPPFALNADQERAIAEIRAAIAAPRYETFLLFGVTGSGKTEVYLQCIETALARGRSALVLLPEIALTPQTVARFRERFGAVAVLHSLLPAGERSREYARLRAGEVRVAVGARSALFAPLRDLGVIVVDESHDASYKQESTPRYHGRDLATVRAMQLGIPCILGSATPAMESLANARRGAFTLLMLPARATAHSLPSIEVIDRRREETGRGPQPGLLSPRLAECLRETVRDGGQAILLLNRRGFARHIHCDSCGFVLRCPECDISLTYHKRAGHVLCHYCGHAAPFPAACPECGANAIRRAHAGTERIEEVLARLLPDTPIGRLDRDTATSRDRLEEILRQFRAGATRVLVGTQMVAKGHDIPEVTLVGVIDADISLHLPDFRAAERTAQLLCQVAGRAGRGARAGRVLVQTRTPEHYAIEAARRQDMEYLFEREAATRQLLCYPPFGHLVRVLCEDGREERAERSARQARDAVRSVPELKILGPVPAPLGRLRGRYRVHMLLKGRERAPLHHAAGIIADGKPADSTTRVTVDIDPQNLM